jgi:hypothetical protein
MLGELVGADVIRLSSSVVQCLANDLGLPQAFGQSFEIRK